MYSRSRTEEAFCGIYRRRRNIHGSSLCTVSVKKWLIKFLVVFVALLICAEAFDDHGDDDNDPEEEDEEDDARTLAPTKATPVNRVDELRSKLLWDFVNATTTDAQVQTNISPEAFAEMVASQLGQSFQERLTKLYSKAVTPECRMKIAEHFGYFVNAIAAEESLPFTDVKFTNECNETVYDDWGNLPEGMNIGHIQNRTYQPNRNESYYITDPNRLKLLYVILAHDNANATKRLIEALYEEGFLHQFVVHVDAKYEDTQTVLVNYAASRTDVHVVPDPYRVRVNWGGFSMVNATLQALRFAFALDKYDDDIAKPKRRLALMFHKLVHLSSSTYPIASNPEIRYKLASYPLDANFLHVIMQPTHPNPYVWHYFVECDDAVHRIYQIPHLRRDVHGIGLYTSSQWFIISRQFAYYLAVAAPGTMVDQYLRYIEHVVVADETFFGTVLRQTEFCHHHHNENFVHLQFDRWENALPTEQRDARKCPMPDPDHCGRSPTTMTLDYADIMELSADLFARKFDDSVDTKVKDVIDEWRRKRAHAIENEGLHPGAAFQMKNVEFEGHGVLIVAKDTVSNSEPLCLALGEEGNKAELLPCFQSWVPATLAPDWETGAVVLNEVKLHTRWKVGPCTTDGHVERLESGIMNVTLGKYSATGPRCMLQQVDGIRKGRCLDGGSTNFQPGGETQVFPCMREWYQFVSFGDGQIAPAGTLYSTVPSHIVKQIHAKGHPQIPYMCLGVFERGEYDEPNWDDEEETLRIETARLKNASNSERNSTKDWTPLSEFKESRIVMTQCTNVGALIEWVFVPFILEEDLNSTSTEESMNSSSFISQQSEMEIADENETAADDQEL